MKSAYELAMERMERESGPTRQLSEEEKARTAEIEKVYDAKIAELKLSYEGKMDGNPADAEALHSEMTSEISRLENKRDAEKDQIWQS
jgi:hypothetical protein